MTYLPIAVPHPLGHAVVRQEGNKRLVDHADPTIRIHPDTDLTPYLDGDTLVLDTKGEYRYTPHGMDGAMTVYYQVDGPDDPKSRNYKRRRG